MAIWIPSNKRWYKMVKSIKCRHRWAELAWLNAAVPDPLLNSLFNFVQKAYAILIPSNKKLYKMVLSIKVRPFGFIATKDGMKWWNPSSADIDQLSWRGSMLHCRTQDGIAFLNLFTKIKLVRFKSRPFTLICRFICWFFLVAFQTFNQPKYTVKLGSTLLWLVQSSTSQWLTGVLKKLTV